jgi:hypothetical protein
LAHEQGAGQEKLTSHWHINRVMVIMKNTDFEKTIVFSILFAGVLLSILQFVYNRSLWLDEAYLSLNIINKSHFELLKPLDIHQVAPILFLQTEKILSKLIPNSEFGLRLFPLISFSLSLFLFYKTIKAIQQNYYTIMFSLSLFVFNASLIYYSSEVKQYMSDVLVLTSVYYAILEKYKNVEYKYYCLGIVGAISMFLSNVAPIIIFTAGCYLLFDIYRSKKKEILHLTVVSVVWASSFLLYYFLFVHNHPAREFMIRDWTEHKAFMPTNPLDIQFLKFLLYKGIMIVYGLFEFGRIGMISLSILILVGIVSLIRKGKTDIIILTVTPLVLHLFLSSLKMYPFDKRLILYTCPCIIVICSFGFDYLANDLFTYLKIERFRLLVIAIPLLMSSYIFHVGFPIKHVEIKKSITFIEQNMYKKDKLYLNYFARFPFQYYQEISFVRMDTNNIVIGKRNRIVFDGNRYVADTIDYSNELSLLSGRVWFLFTQIGDEDEKMKFAINFFGSRGKSMIQEFHTKGSDVYLYDISN